jgi:hypothetical protein
VEDRSISLRFDPNWLASNPLTVSDLEREQGYLQGVGYSLQFS